jgi:hypothetical protein
MRIKLKTLTLSDVRRAESVMPRDGGKRSSVCGEQTPASMDRGKSGANYGAKVIALHGAQSDV